MPTLHRFDREGGFTVADTAEGFTAYAAPTSYNAEQAKSESRRAGLAETMIAVEELQRWNSRDRAASGAREATAEADRRNMARLHVGITDKSTRSDPADSNDTHVREGRQEARHWQNEEVAEIQTVIRHYDPNAAGSADVRMRGFRKIELAQAGMSDLQELSRLRALPEYQMAEQASGITGRTPGEEPQRERAATYAEAKTEATRAGFTIQKVSETMEYRLAPRNGTPQEREDRAYYATDLQDALGTLRAQTEERRTLTVTRIESRDQLADVLDRATRQEPHIPGLAPAREPEQITLQLRPRDNDRDR